MWPESSSLRGKTTVSDALIQVTAVEACMIFKLGVRLPKKTVFSPCKVQSTPILSLRLPTSTEIVKALKVRLAYDIACSCSQIGFANAYSAVILCLEMVFFHRSCAESPLTRTLLTTSNRRWREDIGANLSNSRPIRKRRDVDRGESCSTKSYSLFFEQRLELHFPMHP